MKGTGIKHIALSVLLGVAAAAVAWLFPLGLLLSPALYALVGVIWGWGCLSAALGAACAALGVAVGRMGGGAAALAGLILLVLPASLVIACYFTGKRPYRTAVALSALSFGLAIYALACLPYLLEGEGPFYYFEEAAALFGEQLVAFAEAEGVTGNTLEHVERLAAYTKYMAPDAAALTIVGAALLAGLADVLLCRALCRMAGAGDKLKPMAPFHLWQLSRNFVSGCMVLLLGALAIMLLDIPNASAATMAIQCIVGGPYALMGLCLLAFGKKRRARGNGFFIMSIAALVLLLPYSVYGLCFMGAFDRIFRMRRPRHK